MAIQNVENVELVAEITNNESIRENLQIIAENPDLSKDLLSPQQVAA